jgi:hypothetical protein
MKDGIIGEHNTTKILMEQCNNKIYVELTHLKHTVLKKEEENLSIQFQYKESLREEQLNIKKSLEDDLFNLHKLVSERLINKEIFQIQTNIEQIEENTFCLSNLSLQSENMQLKLEDIKGTGEEIVDNFSHFSQLLSDFPILQNTLERFINELKIQFNMEVERFKEIKNENSQTKYGLSNVMEELAAMRRDLMRANDKSLLKDLKEILISNFNGETTKFQRVTTRINSIWNKLEYDIWKID